MVDQQRSTKTKKQKLPIAPTHSPKKSTRIPKPPPRPAPYSILTELGTKKRKRDPEKQDPKHSKKRESIIIKDEETTPLVSEPGIGTKEKNASGSKNTPIDLDSNPVLGSTPETAIDLDQSDEEPKRETRAKETKVRSRDAKLQAWVEEVPDESLFCTP